MAAMFFLPESSNSFQSFGLLQSTEQFLLFLVCSRRLFTPLLVPRYCSRRLVFCQNFLSRSYFLLTRNFIECACTNKTTQTCKFTCNKSTLVLKFESVVQNFLETFNQFATFLGVFKYSLAEKICGRDCIAFFHHFFTKFHLLMGISMSSLSHLSPKLFFLLALSYIESIERLYNYPVYGVPEH